MRFTAASFHAEAAWQGECAGCGSTTPLWQAHHAVYEQEVKRRRPELIYDPRLALRLCVIPITGCHFRQHDGTAIVPVSTRKLTDGNLEVAFELMGVYAVDYLRARYDDTDPDPRLAAMEAMAA